MVRKSVKVAIDARTEARPVAMLVQVANYPSTLDF